MAGYWAGDKGATGLSAYEIKRGVFFRIRVSL
jgi:hypothetical protein